MTLSTLLQTEDLTVAVDPAAGGRKLSLLDKIWVEKGTADDWRLLEALHYKASSTGVGPIYSRAVLEEDGRRETIAVMILTVPKPLDAGRNEVFPRMRPNANGRDTKLMNSQRTNWLNKNIRSGSRLVIDTMYRSAGLGYRFCNLGFRMSGFRFVETRSSMGRYNPFWQRAGMLPVRPKSASALEQGLIMFARNFASPAHDYVAIMQELDAMPEHVRDRTLADMRDFYYRSSAMEKSGEKRLNGRDRVNALPVPYLLKQCMQLTFGATVYAVYQNPDRGRQLPERLPITAFDNQAPSEPLRLDLL